MARPLGGARSWAARGEVLAAGFTRGNQDETNSTSEAEAGFSQCRKIKS